MMHDCLRIPELQSHVALQVEDKCTLASLARVSKSFKGPALDALYTDVSFSDFLLCLPADLWQRTSSTVNGVVTMSFAFTRRMTMEDWDALQTYSCRVINFTVSLQGGYITAGVCDALCRCPIPILFPKLRSLEAHLNKNDGFRLLNSILLGPQLRHLTIWDVSPTHDLLLHYSPKLAITCPLIETLELPIHGTLSEPSLGMSETVCALKNLRSLNCGIVDEHMLAHLSRIPSLRSLVLYAAASSQWLGINCFISLRNLKELSLDTDTGDTAIRALERVLPCSSTPTPRKLSGLCIVICRTLQACSLSAFIATLRRLCDADLARISLSDTQSKTIGPVSVNHFDSLRPLTYFRNLEFLFIHFSNSEDPNLALSDTQILDLASHWPRLEALTINYLVEPISLNTLVKLIRLLPHAETVAVSTMITDVDMADVDGLESPLPTFEHITGLSVGYEQEYDESSVTKEDFASFLLRLAPNLSYIDQVGSDIDWMYEVIEELEGQRLNGSSGGL